MKTRELISRIWCALNDQGHEATIPVKLSLPGDVPLLDFVGAEVVTEPSGRYVKITIDENTFEDWSDQRADAIAENVAEVNYLRGAEDAHAKY